MISYLATIQEQIDTVRGTNSEDAENVIVKVLRGVYFAVGIVAIVIIVYGGYCYLTSKGDATKIQKGKNAILYGIVGLVIAISAAAITNFILNNV